MKTILKTIALGIILMLTGCKSVKQIGSLNVISTRNFSLKENYVVIKSYAGSGRKMLRKNRGKTIDDAVNNLVRSVPGGEFIQNARVYTFGKSHYAVDGDVYGIVENKNFKGFRVGDRVQWFGFKGTITELIDDNYAAVTEDAGTGLKRVKYDDMIKLQ